jgi:hypothetical protein
MLLFFFHRLWLMDFLVCGLNYVSTSYGLRLDQQFALCSFDLFTWRGGRGA